MLQTTNAERVLAFEYVLKNLLNWHKEITRQSTTNDLSTLKSIKLLFFVSAVKAKNDQPGFLLDQIFNNFVAMPFGHVESNIYNEIKRTGGELTYYKIDNKRTTPLPKNITGLENSLSNELKNEIKSSVDTLKSINPYLISLSAFELVDLSHSWYSWQNAFGLAKSAGSGSQPIKIKDIQQENKVYSLQIF